MNAPKWPLRLMLDLSTAHLKPSTRRELEMHSPQSFPLAGGITKDGFLIHSGTGDEDAGNGIPAQYADLTACCAYARAQGADYLLFDCDADMIPGLAAFHEDGSPMGVPISPNTPDAADAASGFGGIAARAGITGDALKMLEEINETIERHDIRGSLNRFSEVAGDTLDGYAMRNQIAPLVARRLLTVIHYGFDDSNGRDPLRDLDPATCGSSWSVNLTEKAVQMFWPDRIVEAPLANSPNASDALILSAIDDLKAAREKLKQAGAVRALERVRLPLTSAGGAQRNAVARKHRA